MANLKDTEKTLERINEEIKALGNNLGDIVNKFDKVIIDIEPELNIVHEGKNKKQTELIGIIKEKVLQGMLASFNLQSAYEKAKGSGFDFTSVKGAVGKGNNFEGDILESLSQLNNFLSQALIDPTDRNYFKGATKLDRWIELANSNTGKLKDNMVTQPKEGIPQGRIKVLELLLNDFGKYPITGKNELDTSLYRYIGEELTGFSEAGNYGVYGPSVYDYNAQKAEQLKEELLKEKKALLKEKEALRQKYIQAIEEYDSNSPEKLSGLNAKQAQVFRSIYGFKLDDIGKRSYGGVTKGALGNDIEVEPYISDDFKSAFDQAYDKLVEDKGKEFVDSIIENLKNIELTRGIISRKKAEDIRSKIEQPVVSKEDNIGSDIETPVKESVEEVKNSVEEIKDSVEEFKKAEKLINDTVEEAVEKVGEHIEVKVGTENFEDKIEQVEELKDAWKQLGVTIQLLAGYKGIFKEMPSDIVSATDYMDVSAEELIYNINKLETEAYKLKDAFGNIKKADTKGIEDFNKEVQELETELHELTPSIIGTIEELGKTFEYQFRIADGIDADTGEVKYSTGILKQELNELVRLFENKDFRIEVKNLRPALIESVDAFKKEVDQIEYEMGLLTRYGKNVDDYRRATGFTIKEPDIATERDRKQDILNNYDIEAKTLGYKGLDDTEFLKIVGYEEHIKQLREDIQALNNVIDKHVKGYIQLSHEASVLLESGKSDLHLFETIGNPFNRTDVESNYGKVDWSKITHSELSNIEKILGTEEPEYIEPVVKKAITSGDESVALSKRKNKRKSEKVEHKPEIVLLDIPDSTPNNGNKHSKTSDSTLNVLDMAEEFGLSVEEVTEVIKEMEEANEKAVSTLDDVNRSLGRTTESVTRYKEELKELLKTNTTLTDEQKKAAIDIDSSKYIEKQHSAVNRLGRDLDIYAAYTVDKEADKVIDLSLPDNAREFGIYTKNLDSAKAKLGELEEQQERTLKELQDPAKVANMTSLGIDNSAFHSIKRALESGLSANLVDGSVDKGTYDEVFDRFNKYIDKFKNAKIAVVSDEELDSLNKLLALQRKITSERVKQENIDKAKSTYEDKSKEYLENQNKLVQARVNIEALEKSKAYALSNEKDPDKKKQIREGYTRAIELQELYRRQAEGSIKQLEAHFKKYNIEIPVVPVISRTVDIGDNFKNDYLKALGDERYKQALVHVKNKEILDNKPMSYDDQAKYYADEVLPYLIRGTEKYIHILDLKQKAEKKAAEETEKAKDREKKAYDEALERARGRVKSTLNVVKSLADGINNAVNKIVSIIRSGISIINKVINTAGKIVVTVGRGIRSLITLFGNLGNRIRQVFSGNTVNNVYKFNGGVNLLKGSITELNSKLTLLKNAFNFVFNNTMLNKGKELLTSISTLNTIIGKDLTNETIAWAQKLESVLGISATDLIADLKQISAILSGLGMESDDVAVASKNLGIMSRYLAMLGLANGSAQGVMDKLVSGMRGETQSIDDLGLSVREAEMDAYLEKLKKQGGEYANISTSFASLNEEARVYVRYSSLISQFLENYNLANYANQLDTVTGRLEVLNQTWDSLGTLLSVAFTKVSAVLAGYLIPLIAKLRVLVESMIASIQDKIKAFENFFGISLNLNLTESLNANLNKLGNVDTSKTEKNLDKTKEKLDEVSEAAKKASGNLQSFDRVNNISSGKDDSASGSNFDYHKLMNSALGNLNELLEQSNEGLVEKLQRNLDETTSKIKDKLGEVIKDVTGREDFDIGFDSKKTSENLKTVWSETLALLKSWGGFFVEIGLKIADDINVGAIATKLSEVLSKVLETANIIREVLQPALDIFYETGIKPIMEYLGISTLNVLDLFIGKLKELSEWFVDNSDKINGYFEKLGETLRNKFFTVVEILKGVIEILKGDLSIETALKIEDGSSLGNLLSIIKSLKDIFVELFTTFADFMKSGALPWLNEKLGQLATWLKENKDKIVELIEKIGSIAWETFKVFVDLVGKLITYVVENPDSVIKFFSGLLALKVGSWFISTAAGLGQALIGLEGFAGAISNVGPMITGAFASINSAVGSIGVEIASKFGLSTLGEVLLGFSGPIAVVVGVITGLVLAFKDLWDTSESFRQAFATMGEKISEHWNKLKEVFTGDGSISELGKALKEFGELLYSVYEVTLKPIFEALFILIGEVGTEAISLFLDLLTSVLTFIVDRLTGAIKICTGVLQVLIGIFTGDIDKIKDGLDRVGEGIKIWFGAIPDFVKSTVNSVIDVLDSLASSIGDTFFRIVDYVKGLFSGLKEAIVNVLGGITGFVSELWNGVKSKASNFGNNIYNKFTGKTTARTALRVTTNANGGSIAGGQLFIANENGNAELIGKIDGTGRTNVANNQMIVQAMTDGVFEGVYNALAEIFNQRGTTSTPGSATIKIDGFGLIDESTLRQLARLLAPYLNSNNINLADIGFSI